MAILSLEGLLLPRKFCPAVFPVPQTTTFALPGFWAATDPLESLLLGRL